MHAPPTVTVIIVAYNSGAYLKACVAALAAQTFGAFEAVIADNASTDGSITALALPDSRFRVEAMGTNLGFAAANNRVAQSSDAAFLALLNPDTVAEPDWLTALIDCAAQHPTAVGIGSRQIRLHAPGILDGVGDVWHMAGLVWRAGEGWPVARAPATQEIFSPCAAAALYRREAFLEVGGFDARFFCYCEDVDLGFRLRAAGGVLLHCAEARIAHAGSGVVGRASEFSRFYGHRNRIFLFLKHTPQPWFALLLAYHLIWNAVILLDACRRGDAHVVWRAYRAAFARWREFRAEAAQPRRKAAFAKLLPLLAAWPWSPITRPLVPGRN